MTIKNISDATVSDLEAEIVRRKAQADVAKAGKPAVVVRAYSGVIFGYLEKKDGQSVELIDARQIWSWDSAGLKEKINTVPDIAAHGLGSGSKVSATAARATVEQVGAMFFVSPGAEKSITSQKWGAK